MLQPWCARRSPGDLVNTQTLTQQVWGRAWDIAALTSSQVKPLQVCVSTKLLHLQVSQPRWAGAWCSGVRELGAKGGQMYLVRRYCLLGGVRVLSALCLLV